MFVLYGFYGIINTKLEISNLIPIELGIRLVLMIDLFVFFFSFFFFLEILTDRNIRRVLYVT